MIVGVAACRLTASGEVANCAKSALAMLDGRHYHPAAHRLGEAPFLPCLHELIDLPFRRGARSRSAEYCNRY